MKLNDFLKNKKMKVSEFANLIKVPQPMISKWKNGNSLPNKENMKKIIKITENEVQPNDFYEDEEE